MIGPRSSAVKATRWQPSSPRRKPSLPKARNLVQVEYEDLPAVFDAAAAMKPEAPRIHPERGDSNICVWDKIRKGDVEAAFARADVIVEGEYHTPYQEHAYLQPEAGLAYIDEEGRITVECAGQWTHADQEQIAHALGLPNEQVRVIYPAIGGAFGGREDYIRANRAGAGGHETQAPGKNYLEPQRIHCRAWQTPPDDAQNQMGRHQSRQAAGSRDHRHRRCRGLYVHQ